MGGIASELRFRVDDGRVVVRLLANTPAQKILARLGELGLDGSLDALEGDPSMTRVRGGTSYLLTFNAGVSIEELRVLLVP